MTFVFWIIVLVVLVGIWACMCYAFPAIGNKFFKIRRAIKSNIDTDDKENKNEGW